MSIDTAIWLWVLVLFVVSVWVAYRRNDRATDEGMW